MKSQKTKLLGLLGLFILPELLWNPVANFIYQMLQTSKSGSTHPFRANFLVHNENLYSAILFVQLLGVLGAAIYLSIINARTKSISNWFIVGLLILISVVTFFCFGLSVSFRSIDIL